MTNLIDKLNAEQPLIQDMRPHWRADLEEELAAYRLARQIRLEHSPYQPMWNVAFYASKALAETITFRLDCLNGLAGEW